KCYATLEGSGQVFEVVVDRLKDLDIPLDELRDPQLARFNSSDVKRVEVDEGGRQLVLVKEKDKDRDRERWKLEKPSAFEAEAGKVTELLDKLSFLQAHGKDVIDTTDLKPYGLDGKPASVNLTVEESKGEGDKKTTKTRQITFLLGKYEADKKKLYVQ